MSIKGITVGTPIPRSDWNQTDPRKADYIKNKPDFTGAEEHFSDKNNPHNVTAEQIGSASVPKSASGSAISIDDAIVAPLHGLVLYGKTTQDGTPTPESPVELVTSGANGAINVSIGLSVDDTEPQTLTVSTPNGLFGVPAANISAYPGNYTDENGQQWICDEIDFARGVYIQRTKTVDMGSLNWRYSTGTNPYFYTEVSKKSRSQAGALCTAYSFEPDYKKWQNCDLVFNDRPIKNYQMVNFVNRAYTDAAAFKAAMSGQTLLVVLETPVETPLSAEELAQYAALHTNKPNTAVYNDAGAEMEVSYFTPTSAIPIKYGQAYESGKLLTIDELGCVAKTRGLPSMVGIVASDVDITAGTSVDGSWEYYDVYK